MKVTPMQPAELPDVAHHVDAYVGERLRERRKALNLSQSELGDMVSLSLQQIQKYEQGINRIASSKLYEFSNVLRVPVNYFFDGFETQHSELLGNDSEEAQLTRTTPLHVFIADSNPADEVLTRKALDMCQDDVEVFSVHGGEELLQFLRHKRQTNVFSRPDIVLLDLNLDKIDGMTALKTIKRDKELKDIPVIILTNSTHRQDMQKSYANGAAGYICKSFDISKFNEDINAAIHYWSQANILPHM